jgi:hypothetical protein
MYVCIQYSSAVHGHRFDTDPDPDPTTSYTKKEKIL